MKVQEINLKIWFESESFFIYRGTDGIPQPCCSCPQNVIDFGGCRCRYSTNRKWGSNGSCMFPFISSHYNCICYLRSREGATT
ncbi:MAG TPA: hypothetical protein VFK40_05670 [Nitrososphaeraceae archaeon]|nr:hypothetical protein [Nitrososphaeraceae archaeon]